MAVSLGGGKLANAAIMATKTEKLNRFAPFFLDQSSSDITFIVGPEDCPEPEKIPAHKIVLASCSPVLNAMFFGGLAEQSDVRIIDASSDGFKEFLEYFYHDELDVAKLKCIVDVMYLAQKYEVNGCLAAILPFVMTTDPLACLELVAKCEFPELEEIVKQVISGDATKFFESQSFVQCDSNILKMILGWDEVKAHGDEVFTVCYRWAENTLKQRDNENEPTPADIREQMNDFFDLIEFSSMKSHVLVENLIKYADFFTKSDLVAIHKVLAIKYPVALDGLPVRTCYLKADEQEHFVKKIESITFESSKEVFFIDYALSVDLIFSNLCSIYPYIMTLSEKPSADAEKDVVLMRKIVRSSFQAKSNDNDNDTIKIQPNTKYEIRLIFPNLTTEQKLHMPFVYTSTVCDLGDEEGLSIEGNSIISQLEFKWRN